MGYNSIIESRKVKNMVRFEPTISYSDEASKIFKEYRELKDKQD